MSAPLSLHNALRRVIATTADPDDAAHRAVGVVEEWLRRRLDEVVPVIRADERQRCVDYLYASPYCQMR